MDKFYVLAVMAAETFPQAGDSGTVRFVRVDPGATPQETQTAIAQKARQIIDRAPRSTVIVLEAIKVASVPPSTQIVWSDIV